MDLPDYMDSIVEWCEKLSFENRIVIVGAVAFGISMIWQSILYFFRWKSNKKKYKLAYEYCQSAFQANTDRVYREMQQKKVLKAQMDEITQKYISAKKKLEQMYDCNIIYAKYRSLIPVTSFCEYLEAGRCKQLEGDNGAYNLYEQEVRQNIIISEMREFAAHLQSVQQKQYMLYQKISEANKRIEEMCETVDRIELDACIAKYNSDSAAQNASAARHAAERTNRFI